MCDAGTFTCFYCAKVLPVSCRSKEHILPRALGGAYCGDVFIADSVCDKCNNNLGLFVDGEFARSFFVSGSAASAALEFADLGGPHPLPLTYYGRLEGVDVGPDHVCEFWMAPCTGRILHVHEHYSERFATRSGGDPIKRRRNPGTAIFLNAATNPVWYTAGLRAFRAHFDIERRILGNIDGDGASAFGTQPTDSDKSIIRAFLKDTEESGHPISSKFGVGTEFEQRFLAKLALGLGTKLLGAGYGTSAFAKRLRSHLFTVEAAQRDTLPPVAGPYFLPEPDDLWLPSVRGAVTLTILPVGSHLVLAFSPFDRTMLVLISDEPSLFHHLEPISAGAGSVHVVVPQRGFYSGSISLVDCIEHQNGDRSNQALAQIERWRTRFEDLPPRQLPVGA
jgi:hypothetical protein